MKSTQELRRRASECREYRNYPVQPDRAHGQCRGEVWIVRREESRPGAGVDARRAGRRRASGARDAGIPRHSRPTCAQGRRHAGAVSGCWRQGRVEGIHRPESDRRVQPSAGRIDQYRMDDATRSGGRVVRKGDVEGVPAVYPGVATGSYTAEEVADMELHDVTSDKPVTIEQAVEQAASALTPDERAEHISAMKEAGDIEGLAAAFSAAWKHAGAANDKPARELFKQVYNSEKASIEAA